MVDNPETVQAMLNTRNSMTDDKRALLKQKAAQMAKQGVCDPLYRSSIKQMLDQQRDDPMDTGLVIINSFDCDLDDIRDEMIDRKIYADVFEVDRLRPDERLEYLNCFQEMFSTKKLPMIFLKDQYIGDFAQMKSQWASQQML